MMANTGDDASGPAGDSDDLFAPQSSAEMARRLGAVPDPDDPAAASSLGAALDAELQGMLTRAMNLDTLDDVEAAKGGGQDDKLPTGGRGAMLAELSVDLDEYKSVEQDIDTITVALDQIDAQSSELKNMLQGLLISQEMARAQHDDGATSSGVDSAVEGQPSASSADSSDVDLDPGLQPL